MIDYKATPQDLQALGEHCEALRQFLQHTQFKPLELMIDGCDEDVDVFDEFKVPA